jgi:hypothetical protein
MCGELVGMMIFFREREYSGDVGLAREFRDPASFDLRVLFSLG